MDTRSINLMMICSTLAATAITASHVALWLTGLAIVKHIADEFLEAHRPTVPPVPQSLPDPTTIKELQEQVALLRSDVNGLNIAAGFRKVK